METRDSNGRFVKGHPGLKPRGSQSEVKAKIEAFVTGKLDSLEQIWQELSPSQRARLFTELVQYVLPKEKHVELIDNTKGSEQSFDVSQLSDDDLRSLLALQEKAAITTNQIL